MIDPRNSPVAMLPILNAVAGHMIAKAAPLRVINVEDTEQMVCEACEAGGFDCDVVEEELRKCTGRFFSFFEDTQAIADMFGTMNWSAEMRMFLDTLQATIEEAV